MNRIREYLRPARIYFFVAILLLTFPLVFGGTSIVPLWMSNYRNPLIAIVILFCFFLFFKSFRGLIYRLARNPLSVLGRKNEFILVSAILLWFLVSYVKASILDYYSFFIHAVDFSTMDHMLHNTSIGKFMYSPICDCNYFSIHPSLIVFLIYPLHFLFDSPLFLVVIHSLILWSAGIPLYILARRQSLENYLCIILLLSFYLLSFTTQILHNGFRFEVFYVPFFFWLFYAYIRKKTGSLIVFSLLICSVKMDGAFYVASLALSILMFGRSARHYGIYLLLISGGYFLFNLKVILPVFGGVDHYMLPVTASKYGNTLEGIITGMLTHPLDVVYDFFTGKWLRVSAAFGIVPLLVPFFWVAVLPFAIIHTSAASSLVESLKLYYSAPFIPLLFFAVMIFMKSRYPYKISTKKIVRGSVVMMVFLYSALFGSGYLSFKQPYRNRGDLDVIKKEIDLRRGRACIEGSILPHMGFSNKLALFNSRCVAQKHLYYLVNMKLNHYPYQESGVVEMLDELEATGLYERIVVGDFLLLRKKREFQMIH